MQATTPDIQSRTVRRVTWVGLITNVLLAGLKFAGGVIGHSQAVVADAVHTLSDIVTDVAILVGVRFWSRPPDPSHPHGHRKVETLVTFGIGVALLAAGFGLLWNAVEGLSLHYHGKGLHRVLPRWPALAAALMSIVCKESLYRWASAVGRRVRSLPLLANAWHNRSDALSSVPAALAVGAAMIEPRWSFLDDVGAIVVSLMIFQASLKIVRSSFGKLADAAAPKEEVEGLQRLAEEVDGVRQVHALRTRYLGCLNLAVDLHVLVDGDRTVREGHDIASVVKRTLLESHPDIVDVVVHLEPCPDGRADVRK